VESLKRFQLVSKELEPIPQYQASTKFAGFLEGIKEAASKTGRGETAPRVAPLPFRASRWYDGIVRLWVAPSHNKQIQKNQKTSHFSKIFFKTSPTSKT
jgi:hypothetical protein